MAARLRHGPLTYDLVQAYYAWIGFRSIDVGGPPDLIDGILKHLLAHTGHLVLCHLVVTT